MSIISRPSRKLASRQDLHVKNIEKIHKEDWNFSDENTQYLLHSLHSYPARFIPQIPKRAISRWSKPGEIVLDPFCGSGTTLLECALSGRNSIGVDNNPVATLISKAKVSHYTKKDFEALEEMIKDVDREKDFRFSHSMQKKLFLRAPKYDSINKWFDKKSIAELVWLKLKILELEEKPRLLALSVFSFIILSASRQDSDTRYAAIERSFKEGYAIKRWITKMKSTVKKAMQTKELIKKSKHWVFDADTRQLSFINDNCVKLIVTSPPYLNAYDYHKYHRHRIHWIDGNVEFARDLEIGKHDVFTRKNAEPAPFFQDMKLCMSEWRRVLLPRGRAMVVIGDSFVNRKFVPVGDNLVKIGKDVGLKLERRWIRKIPSARKSFNHDARIKREHVLLFKNDK